LARNERPGSASYEWSFIMANDTREIPKSEWTQFFAELTRENRGAHATVEVTGRDIGDQMQVADEPLDGVAADDKDSESRIWVTLPDAGAII
jgi:hypothetical protein